MSSASVHLYQPRTHPMKVLPTTKFIFAILKSSLLVSCYTHWGELGHVLQSPSCTKENITDPRPGTRATARKSWKYLHCTELKCLQGAWHECLYVQTIIITGAVVVDHLFNPKSILHLTSETHWLGSYCMYVLILESILAKKKPNWSLNSNVYKSTSMRKD